MDIFSTLGLRELHAYLYKMYAIICWKYTVSTGDPIWQIAAKNLDKVSTGYPEMAYDRDRWRI